MTFWQQVRFYFGAHALMKRLGIPWSQRRAVMRKALKWTGWANIGLVAFQVLNNSAEMFPALKTNPYVMVVNAILGALLPSLGGVSHKLAGTTVVPKEGA